MHNTGFLRAALRAAMYKAKRTAASRCAVPLGLAPLACVEQRNEKPSSAAMGRREDLSLRERQEIIFREHKREHIRVASRELPWVCDGWHLNPFSRLF